MRIVRAATATLTIAASVLAACSLEKMPPFTMVRDGERAPIKHLTLLPSECSTKLCKGLDQLVASELSFRGYDIVDLDRLNAVERTRTEVQVTSSSTSKWGSTSSSSRSLTVRGARLSDVDIWTLRAELRAMGVDAIVRVRTAKVWGRPARVAALIRITRADDARLVASSLCEIEVGTFDEYPESAERSTRCALAKVLR